MNVLRSIVFSALLLSVPSGAAHAALPKPISDMIETAIESDDPSTANAVVRIAKKSNPHAAAEIDAFVAKLKARVDYSRRAKLRRLRFSQGWQGKGEFGATSSTGQVNSAGVAGGLSLVKDGLRWKNAFTTSIDYLRHGGIEERNRYFAGHQVNFKFNDRLYALGLASWEGNRAQGFRSRLITSVGVGYSVIKTSKMSLAVETSPAVRETDYLAGGTVNNFAMRVATNYRWSVTPKLTLTEDQVFFQEGRDQTLASDTALTLKLIDALSARLSYRLQQESKSVPLAKSRDTTSRVSLVYSF
jgi:putative salt-induced outer membrane protein